MTLPRGFLGSLGLYADLLFVFQEAKQLVTQAQADEKRLYLDHRPDPPSRDDAAGRVKRSKVSPPPVLLCRTDTTLVFRPAHFMPSGGEKVTDVLDLNHDLALRVQKKKKKKKGKKKEL